jgi:hypothetical protein
VSYNWGYADANGIDVLAEGLDLFRRGVIASDGRMTQPGNLSLTKGLWLDGCLGDEPIKVGIALAGGLCDMDGSFWLKASMIEVGGPCPF